MQGLDYLSLQGTTYLAIERSRELMRSIDMANENGIVATVAEGLRTNRFETRPDNQPSSDDLLRLSFNPS